MTAPQHVFHVSPDPRMNGHCACGQPEDAHPQPSPDPARNPQVEAEFIATAIDWAEKLGQVRWDGYAGQVRHRLDIGAARYGDTAFLDRDNMIEIREECPDLGAYPVLELQRLMASGASEEEIAQDRMDLLAIAAYGALADHHARLIIRRRAGQD